MDIYGPDDSWWTLEAGGSCSSCSYILPPLVKSTPSFFENGHFICEKCGAEVDLWDVILSRAKSLNFGGWALTSLGAATTRVRLDVETGKYYSIELEDYGAPAGARILDINVSPQGSEGGAVTALVWHGNTVVRRIRGTRFGVIGIPLEEGQLPRVGKVSISIVWIRKEDSDGWLYLLNCFDAFADGDYAPAMVFGQSAVEVSLMPLLTERLRRYASAKSVDSFAGNGLKFAHGLNVLLPNLCGMLQIPQMPDLVRGALNRLRRRRNMIIHEGSLTASIDKDEVAEALTGVVFAFEYVRYISPLLLAGDPDLDTPHQ